MELQGTLLDQSWHDSRYHAAIKGGVSHSTAWAQEKKRRKATLHRQSGGESRLKERIDLDLKWHEEFDNAEKPVKEEEFQDDILEGVETEAVEEVGGIRSESSKEKRSLSNVVNLRLVRRIAS